MAAVFEQIELEEPKVFVSRRSVASRPARSERQELGIEFYGHPFIKIIQDDSRVKRISIKSHAVDSEPFLSAHFLMSPTAERSFSFEYKRASLGLEVPTSDVDIGLRIREIAYAHPDLFEKTATELQRGNLNLISLSKLLMVGSILLFMICLLSLWLWLDQSVIVIGPYPAALLMLTTPFFYAMGYVAKTK